MAPGPVRDKPSDILKSSRKTRKSRGKDSPKKRHKPQISDAGAGAGAGDGVDEKAMVSTKSKRAALEEEAARRSRERDLRDSSRKLQRQNSPMKMFTRGLSRMSSAFGMDMGEEDSQVSDQISAATSVFEGDYFLYAAEVDNLQSLKSTLYRAARLRIMQQKMDEVTVEEEAEHMLSLIHI